MENQQQTKSKLVTISWATPCVNNSPFQNYHEKKREGESPYISDLNIYSK